jgi:mono/diheme cytochrome c family protein
MRNFVSGILFTWIVLCAGGYWIFEKGYVNFAADQRPSDVESKLARSARDASADRRAPVRENPIAPTEKNLAVGAKIYLDHCAGCHGVPSNPESAFSWSFYPPVPGFFKGTPDLSEKQNFYAIQHGVRWTGMPAWGGTLPETQIWQVVTFLNNIQKLPPAAQNVFGSESATAPASPPSPMSTPMAMPVAH